MVVISMSFFKQELTARLVSVAYLLIAMMSIQSGASLAKRFFPLVGPEGATALRLFFAALMLIVFIRPWHVRHTVFSFFSVLGYGIALGGMNLLFYKALQTLPLGIAVAFEFTGPLLIAVCSSRRALDFVWILFAVLGLYLLLPFRGEPIDLVGVFYALSAGACWAGYILFGRRTGQHYGAEGVAIGMIVAAMLVVPIGIAKIGAVLFDPALIPLALLLAFLSSALPYSLEMKALTRLPTRTFGILMSMEPVIAVFSGLLFLDEKLSLLQWSAILLIVLASSGTTLSVKAESL
jgi:inner membrane transporter RhtA